MIKIDSLKFGAVIPTQQYGNLQPEIILSGDVSVEEASKVGIGFISDLFAKYSEKGGLIEKTAIKVGQIKPSFNEEGINILFDPIKHEYSHGGNSLQGATDYIKKFYKPFDGDTISGVLESKWGVPQQVIKDIWKGNGDISSAFGNLIHAALEHYYNFKDMGEVIASAKKEKYNYALPAHPILRAIIEEFIAIDKAKGKIKSEVLITDIDNGLCGHADRVEIIDEKKKICRVGDYKVNINSEEIDSNSKVLAPFASLPANKLSKYQLQMSIYANMLQSSGWKVEGLDVYVYEDTWKHYELPVLQIINK